MNQELASQIIDLKLDGYTTLEISKKLKLEKEIVAGVLDQVNLTGYKSFKVSKPQELIYRCCCDMFGHDKVHQEYTLSDGTRADVAVPSQALIIEYHGEQHFNFIEFFHKTIDNLHKIQYYDLRKEDLCRRNNWCYIVFNYKDKLTDTLIKDKILTELLIHVEQEHGDVKKSGEDARKQKAKEYRKSRYRYLKTMKNGRK